MGFEKNDAEGKLVLEGDGALPLLAATAAKLAKAEETYRQVPYIASCLAPYLDPYLDPTNPLAQALCRPRI